MLQEPRRQKIDFAAHYFHPRVCRYAAQRHASHRSFKILQYGDSYAAA